MKKHENERALMLASHLIRQSFKNIPVDEIKQLILCTADIPVASQHANYNSALANLNYFDHKKLLI